MDRNYLFDRGSFFSQPESAPLLRWLPFPPGLIHQRTRDEPGNTLDARETDAPQAWSRGP